MPGLHMGCSQVQRQTLKQEQRMEIQLTQRLIAEYDTDGGRDAAVEVELLKRIGKDLASGVYVNVANFALRVGKRVPKKDRTPSRRAIVQGLRDVVAFYEPATLDAVQTFVDWGLKLHTRWNALPSEEYGMLIEAARTERFATPELRRALWELVRENAEREEGTLNLNALIGDVSRDSRFDAARVNQFLTKLGGTRARTIQAYGDLLFESLPDALTAQDLNRALELVESYDRLLGHLHLAKPVHRFRSYLESGSAWPEAIPDVVRAFLPTLDPGRIVTLATFFGDDALKTSIDSKRDVLRAIIILAELNDYGAACLVHMLSHAGTAKQFARIARLAARRGEYRSRDLSYPLEATTAEETIRELSLDREVTAALDGLNLRPEHRDQFMELMNRQSRITEIILRLADIYRTHASDVLPVLARITEAVLDETFTAWRYEHDAATAQLAPIRATPIWKENKSEYRVLGASDGVRPRLEAVRLLQALAAANFAREHGQAWSRDLGSKLETIITKSETKLRDPQIPGEEKKAMVAAVRELRHVYQAARLIELFDIGEPAGVEFVLQHWRDVRSKPWAAPYADLISQGQSILNAPEVRDMRLVQISESDNLLDLLQIGIVPVLSCQRWTEATGYNKCLLAYVADPNKKLWQVRTRSGEVVGRAVVRLLPFRKSALLLLEPPYATRWTDEHTRALVAAILEKAVRLSKDIGKPVAVGYVGIPRWGAWGKAFEEIGAQFDIKPKTSNFRPRLPESFNLYEYSDSLGGCLKRGITPAAVGRLTYFVVGDESAIGDDD